MFKYPLQTLLASACIATAASAQTTLIDNDFNSVTEQNYAPGVSFGSPTLGNAANQQATTVSGGTGIGGSIGATGNNFGVASSSEYSIETETSFDFYFQYQTDTRADIFVFTGWSENPTNTLFTGTQSETRQFIGLGRTSGDTVQFEFGHRQNASAITGSPTFALSDGNFYRFTGSILWNSTDTTWDLASLAVQDFGVSGTSAGSIVGSLASASVDPGADGTDLINSGSSFFVIGGNAPRGLAALDNVVVTSAIPEPSTVGVFMAAVLAGLVFYRRRSV